MVSFGTDHQESSTSNSSRLFCTGDDDLLARSNDGVSQAGNPGKSGISFAVFRRVKELKNSTRSYLTIPFFPVYLGCVLRVKYRKVVTWSPRVVGNQGSLQRSSGGPVGLRLRW